MSQIWKETRLLWLMQRKKMPLVKVTQANGASICSFLKYLDNDEIRHNERDWQQRKHQENNIFGGWKGELSLLQNFCIEIRCKLARQNVQAIHELS